MQNIRKATRQEGIFVERSRRETTACGWQAVCWAGAGKDEPGLELPKEACGERRDRGEASHSAASRIHYFMFPLPFITGASSFSHHPPSAALLLHSHGSPASTSTTAPASHPTHLSILFTPLPFLFPSPTSCPPLAPIPSSLGKSSPGAAPGPARPGAPARSLRPRRDRTEAGRDRGRRTDRSLFPAPSQELAPPPPSHQAFLHRPCCDVAAGLSRAPAAPPSALGCGLSAAHNLQTRHPLCGLLARAPTALTPATQPSTPSLSCPAAPPVPCATLMTPYGVSTGGPTEPQHLIPLSPLTSAILGRSD